MDIFVFRIGPQFFSLRRSNLIEWFIGYRPPIVHEINLHLWCKKRLDLVFWGPDLGTAGAAPPALGNEPAPLCPEGTVAVRRVTEDVLRASSVERFGRKAASRGRPVSTTGTGHEVRLLGQHLYLSLGSSSPLYLPVSH